MLAIAAFVFMREASGLLGRIVLNGSSASMSVLTGPHLAPWRHAVISDAFKAWFTPAAPSAPLHAINNAGLAHELVVASLVVDTFVFIPAYAVVLWRLIGSVTASNRPWREPLMWTLFSLVVVDVAENVVSSVLVGLGWDGHANRGLSIALPYLSDLKWLAFVVVIAGIVLARVSAPSNAPARRWGERGRWLSRMRVQLVVVAALALIAIAPGGGALDQLPDLLRHYADDGQSVKTMLASTVPAVLALGLLVVSIWLTGRWALLEDCLVGTARRRRATSLIGGVLWTAATAAVAVILFLSSVASPGVFVLPGLLVLVLALTPLTGATFRSGWNPTTSTEKVDDVHWPAGIALIRLRRLVSILAAAPVAIAGVGMVRAFAAPVLVESFHRWQAVFWLVVGVVVSVAGPAITSFVLDALAVRTGVMSPWSSRLVFAGLAGAVLAAGVTAGVWPLLLGDVWKVNGLLTLMAAGIVLIGGFVQYLVEVNRPLFVTYRFGLGRRTPVFALFIVVFVATNALNFNSHYHDVRRTAAVTEPSAVSIEATFASWLHEQHTCGDGQPRTRPLLLVAAPGGGIRAAYWTIRALDFVSHRAVTNNCGPTSVFAASGVSGGSVGLVAQTLHDFPPAGAARDDHHAANRVLRGLGWAHDRSGIPERDLADDTSLSAVGAALLFRDVPRAVLGLSEPWDDRAAVLERAWQDRDPQLDATFYSELRPGPTPDGWRPLLFLNGTEASTGCRVIVSPAPLAATKTGDVRECVTPTAVIGSGQPPTQLQAAGAVDASTFLGDCGDAADDLRASTAALLSARFPLVSPAGAIHRCAKPHTTLGDLDGGAAENSGLETILDLWHALQPDVAGHNACVSAHPHATSTDCDGAADVTVEPLLVLLDNHYYVERPSQPVKPPSQTRSLLNALHAGALGSSEAVLEQRALQEFTDPTRDTSHPGTAPRVRFYRVSPAEAPDVAAPLGWTLSDVATGGLDERLLDRVDTPCVVSADPAAAASLNCLVLALSQFDPR